MGSVIVHAETIDWSSLNWSFEMAELMPVLLYAASSLETLDLSNNSLRGPIPPQIGEFTRLKTLLLRNNAQMDPLVPVELKELDRLETLILGKALDATQHPKLSELPDARMGLNRDQIEVLFKHLDAKPERESDA